MVSLSFEGIDFIRKLKWIRSYSKHYLNLSFFIHDLQFFSNVVLNLNSVYNRSFAKLTACMDTQAGVMEQSLSMAFAIEYLCS